MKAHLVGSGLASLAAAAYLIKDGGFLGTNISIYEAGSQLGGAMGKLGGPSTGYILPTGRVFEKDSPAESMGGLGPWDAADVVSN